MKFQKKIWKTPVHDGPHSYITTAEPLADEGAPADNLMDHVLLSYTRNHPSEHSIHFYAYGICMNHTC